MFMPVAATQSLFHRIDGGFFCSYPLISLGTVM
jgi:hypothetical protein